VLGDDLTTGRVAAAVALLAIVAVAAIWLVPRLQARRWRAMGLETEKVAELENSARGTLVQAFGAIALILTFVATWVQIDDTREAGERTFDLTRSQQESERFTRAVEQLGSGRLEVRLGGIYALEQAARESPRRRRAVAELMMAYLKRSHPLRRNDPRLARVHARNLTALNMPIPTACESTVARPWPDTQAAIAVLVGLPRRSRGRFDLAEADLVGVRLRGADFYGVDLRDASLADADLERSNFERATLVGTDLRQACFRDARFAGAVVGRADTLGSDFRGVDMNFKAYGNFTTGLDKPLYGALTDDCARVPKDSGLALACGRSP
jgi:hypothetical protein